MRLLFIGGTGLISSACSDLALERGHELFILTRGRSTKYPIPKGATLLRGDIQAADDAAMSRLLEGLRFDAVVDFLAYEPKDIDRDVSSLQGLTDQFVFVSSASAYQKPPRTYLLDEQTPLVNPYWQYSRDKIACEVRLMQAHAEQDFPATIVRPSLTYGPSQLPFCVGSWAHPWTIIDRIRRGGKVIVPGDGTSLWALTWNADFAVGLLGLLGNAPAIGQAFHITSDEVLTWDQIYLEAFHALGMTPNILHVSSDLISAYWPHALGSLIGDKMYSVVFNNAKIKRAVPGFSCATKWADGLRRALQWHELRPQFQTIDAALVETLDQIVQAHADLSSAGRNSRLP